MLTTEIIEDILAKLPNKTIGLIGDLFLDRYLDIDATLTEPSIETGLDAYQVTRVRNYPGALGTVINNLAALGVGRIVPITVIGEDGEGFDVLRALKTLKIVETEGILQRAERRTPTYCKPMFMEPGMPPRELNRLDTKNRTATATHIEEELLKSLLHYWEQVDALLVLDQVSEANCGVVTDRVTVVLRLLAGKSESKFVMADSRNRIGQFTEMWIKPNESEAKELEGRSRMVVTRGGQGADLHTAEGVRRVPAYPVTGPIDICGAGDSCSAAIACAMCCGHSPEIAAAFGNLVASITIQQIGVTGTATPAQVRARWKEVGG